MNRRCSTASWVIFAVGSAFLLLSLVACGRATPRTEMTSAGGETPPGESPPGESPPGTAPGDSAPGTTVGGDPDQEESDRNPVSVSFAAATYEVPAGASVGVTVTLSGEPGRTVEIPLVATNQGDTANEDWSLAAATLTFGPGDTTRSVAFEAVEDGIDLDDRTNDKMVTLGFGDLPQHVSAGSKATVVIHESILIEQDDHGLGTVYDADDVDYFEVVPESTGCLLVVASRTAPGSPVTRLFVSVTDRDGQVVEPTKSVDEGARFRWYGPAVGGVTYYLRVFAATNGLYDIAFEIDSDDCPVGATASPPERERPPVTPPTDDPPGEPPEIGPGHYPSTVSFAHSTYEVPAGGKVTVGVRLTRSTGATGMVEIPLTTTSGATTADTDYAVPVSILTFGPGETSVDFPFAASADTATIDTDADDDDPTPEDKTVTLGFGDLSQNISVGSSSTATVTIHESLAGSGLVSLGSADDVDYFEVTAAAGCFRVEAGRSLVNLSLTGLSVRVVDADGANIEPDATSVVPDSEALTWEGTVTAGTYFVRVSAATGGIYFFEYYSTGCGGG